MKFCSLLCFLLCVCGIDSARALVAAAVNYGSEMSTNADVQADFFTRYPDLQDEREMVAQAARALAAEGVDTGDVTAASEMLARRTRAQLARRTPQEWQQQAVRLFPDLGVAGSEFNTRFLQHFKELQRTSPQFMEEPSWPVLLARRCADELQPNRSARTLAAAPKTTAPAAANSVTTPPQPTKRAGFWSSLLNLALLLAIIVQPARWLLRCSRAFAGTGAPLTLWQRALRPAAWTYLGVALLALARTFLANADQRFIDRFGITLLVSLLAGVVFALPAFGAALAGMYWWQRAPRGVKLAEAAAHGPAEIGTSGD